MPLTVRLGAVEDTPVVVEFNRLMALETENKVLDLAVLTPGVRSGLADPGKAIYFLAENDGQVMGQLMLTREWSDWRNGWFWWIQSVYVRAEYRRLGVFRQLYRHIHELAARETDVVGLRLYVENENHAAQAVYTDLGMTPIPFKFLQRRPR